MKTAALQAGLGFVLAITSMVASGQAGTGSQRSGDLVFDHGETSVERAKPEPKSEAAKPNPDGHGPSDRANGGPGFAATRPDPYPALTQANNAYKQAVAVWQQANQKYEAARAKQVALKEKYLDANGSVRAGMDYYAAVAVLHAADNEVQDTYLELGKAEAARNAANSAANKEFAKASEQFAQAQRAGAEAAAREAARQKRQADTDRHSGNH